MAETFGIGDRLPEFYTGIAVIEYVDGVMVKFTALSDLERCAVVAVLHGVEYTPAAKVISSPVETVVTEVAGKPAQVVVDTVLPHRADLA